VPHNVSIWLGDVFLHLKSGIEKFLQQSRSQLTESWKWNKGAEKQCHSKAQMLCKLITHNP